MKNGWPSGELLQMFEAVSKGFEVPAKADRQYWIEYRRYMGNETERLNDLADSMERRSRMAKMLSPKPLPKTADLRDNYPKNLREKHGYDLKVLGVPIHAYLETATLPYDIYQVLTEYVGKGGRGSFQRLLKSIKSYEISERQAAAKETLARYRQNLSSTPNLPSTFLRPVPSRWAPNVNPPGSVAMDVDPYQMREFHMDQVVQTPQRVYTPQRVTPRGRDVVFDSDDYDRGGKWARHSTAYDPTLVSKRGREEGDVYGRNVRPRVLFDDIPHVYINDDDI